MPVRYRVRPQTHSLELGQPSEAVCETGRILDGKISDGDSLSVVVSVHGLDEPMTSMNGCRISYPDTFSYIPLSFNIGSPGGERDAVDGVWSSFAEGILFPPDAFIFERAMGDGTKVIDFNVTALGSGSQVATLAGHGDMFNFELRDGGAGEALTLSYVDQTEDGVKRTYFSGTDEAEHFFGNTLSL
ncbi:MAG: hypothetical protein M3R04_03560 [bacterium]|nr:hypothetical protein [bacterium]